MHPPFAEKGQPAPPVYPVYRRSWLFFYVVKTARTNGLNPFQYLKHLFEYLPNANIQRIGFLS
ncbi:transposase domain-containing protein [Mitsuokella multacida]|uniref:transposase domain-containing protein n=1 Tax=Mitsuokella multacida TaxID=52226 RepID=UPI003C7C835D